MSTPTSTNGMPVDESGSAGEPNQIDEWVDEAVCDRGSVVTMELY